MGKKIVLVTGSMRKSSNTTAMADSFANAAKGEGIDIVRFDAANAEIGVCHVCNTCFSTGNACTFADDFNSIANEILEADGIVIACPVYWYTFPAKVKALLDKFYAFCVGERSFKDKKVALITCCEESEMSTFDGINFAFDKTFQLLEAEVVQKFEIPGVNEECAIKNTDGELQAANLAKLFL